MIFNVSLSHDSLHVGPYRVPVHLIFHQSDNQGGFKVGNMSFDKTSVNRLIMHRKTDIKLSIDMKIPHEVDFS